MKIKRRLANLVSLVFRSKGAKEEGQGLVELTVAVSLLAVIIVVSFEFALVFTSYIALLNSARAGARYASRHPEILVTPKTIDDAQYDTYRASIEDEAWASGLDRTNLIVTVPETKFDGLGNPIVGGGQPVTATLHYNLTTFTSGIRLPFFGRFGLPSTYRITARASFPIGGE
jgi:hypothetical protein